MNIRDLRVKGLRDSGIDCGSFYVKQYNSKLFLVRVL
jgi:hypothetical protein